ncbi:transposable element Tcb2 transposase [Trichonephila clavipes]|nr:transposable element Tcb2 transposase [Trichonephila clavipes]
MSALSIRRRLLHRRLRIMVPLYRIPLTANHRRLRLQWAHEHRAWQADWHQVVFSDESRINLWDHDGCIRFRRHAGERCLPECVIEGLKHPELWFGVRFRIMDDPICYELRPNTCNFFLCLLICWDMSPIVHVWDSVGWRLAHVPRPAVSKDELLLRIQAIWNSFPQADIQNLFDSMPRHIATLIAARGGYTKY